jgi:predicted nuclease of predicted toxin-antitoxin system
MRVLFDQGTPAPLRRHLAGHDVSTAYEMGWAELRNGDLLAAAEQVFEVMITTDQSLRHQQSLAGRKLAIVVLSTTSWPRVQKHAAAIATALSTITVSQVVEIAIPR